MLSITASCFALHSLYPIDLPFYLLGRLGVIDNHESFVVAPGFPNLLKKLFTKISPSW